MAVANDIRAVVLTDDEWEMGLKIAAGRQHGKEPLDSTRNYKAEQHSTSLGVHRIGALGEVAVAKYLGWPVDVAVKMDGDSGRDFLCGGWKIDVQTTTYYRRPHLKYDSTHPFRAHVAILVAQHDRLHYRIHGWISKTMFDKHCSSRIYKADLPPRQIISKLADLNSIDELIGVCTSHPNPNPR